MCPARLEEEMMKYLARYWDFGILFDTQKELADHLQGSIGSERSLQFAAEMMIFLEE